MMPAAQETHMPTLFRKTFAPALLVLGLLCGAALPARAHSEASAALSLMPVASVVVAAGGASAAAGAVVALPAALSVGGAVLTVKAVQASATGTVYLLERASDGAQASVEVSGRAAGAASGAVGTVLTCTVIGRPIWLSARTSEVEVAPGTGFTPANHW